MTRNNLTTAEKRRLQRNQLCPICNQLIKDTDNFLYTIKKVGRCKAYTFYHERCLIHGEKEKSQESKESC